MPDTLPAATPATAAPAAAPSPASSSAAATPKAGGGSFDLEFSELDALAAEKEKKPEAKPAEAKVAEHPKEGEKPKEGEAPKEGDKPPAEDPNQKPPAKAAELRNAYEAQKKRVADLERENSELKLGKGKTDDGELARYKETMAEKVKRLEELETEIKYTNYEKSTEYRETYDKPIQKAFSSAWSDIGEMLVTEPNGDTRRATEKDFTDLMHMNINDATAKAKEMFGDLAPEVLAHRREIVKLNRSRHEAIERFKKEGSEREKQTVAEREKQVETLNKIWNETNKDAAEKYPEWFAPDEKDPEGSKSLAAGFELADAAFVGIGKIPVDQLAKIQATVRNRAAGFGRAVIKYKAAMDRITALEKEVEGFKKSAPGGEAPGASSKTGDLSANDELDALAK